MTENLNWRKSTRSGQGASQCVELALCVDRTYIRDSKNPAVGMLTVSHAAWSSFLDAVKRGAVTR